MNNIGCVFLEEGINFDFNQVMDCCILHHDNRGLPLLINNYKGEPIDWEKLFEIKAKRIEAQKQATIYDCEGCYHLGEYTFKNIKKLSEFHFSHCRICNAKCVYCSKEYSSDIQNYSTYPIIKDLIDKGYYKAGGEATFQGGEPTLMKNFDELVELFVDNGTKVRIHTSGIRYSQTVEKALRENKGSIVVSIDSASQKVYKNIKRVDAFDLVCSNIRKYSVASGENSNNIIVKYIIVPGYNDTIDEIDKFFSLMKNFGIKNVAVDIELQYARKYDYKNVSEHIYILYDYFMLKAAQNDMKLLTYSFITYVLQNRVIKNTPKMLCKWLYVLYVNKHKDRTKNIAYVKY